MSFRSRALILIPFAWSAAGYSRWQADGNGAEGRWQARIHTHSATVISTGLEASRTEGGGKLVEPLETPLGVPVVVPGRRVLTSVLDSSTFKLAIIVVCAVVGFFLLVALIWGIFTKCGRSRSAPVAPGTDAGAKGARGAGSDVEKGPAAANPGPIMTPPTPLQTTSGAAVPPAAPPTTAPMPPWKSDPQRLPPGIMLAPVTPPMYSPLVSNPRLDTEPPYERLVLISSRVHKPDMVARAVLPNVAYVVYDWKNFTLHELLRYIKKALGSQKVTSIAVVAPGSKAGTVGLLEGAGTSPEKLTSKTELSQFWRVLAGCVALSGSADGRRVDLLGCRIVEAPREGAALLKELWNLTTVPFAAADDALGGYMLCTFMEEPTTRQLSLISSTIPAIDLYFNRFVLLGIPPPGKGEGGEERGAALGIAASAPLPPGPPPPGAIAPVGTAPPMASKPAPAPGVAAPAAAPAPADAHVAVPPALPPSVPAPPVAPMPPAVVAASPALLPPPAPDAKAPATPAPQPPAPTPDAKVAAAPAGTPSSAEGLDVFTRLTRALQQQGKTLEAAFAEFDRDGNGQLSTQELTELMRVHVPGASPMDIKHFQAMLDTDALSAGQELLLSRQEFVQGLPENVQIQEQVRTGRDDDEVVPRLQDYLTGNEQILRDTFEQFDENADGHLDHLELQELVSSIPGLKPREKKFILALLYVHDKNRDQRINLDELLAALKQFGKDHTHRPSFARAVMPPGPGAPPAATPATAPAPAGDAQQPQTAGAVPIPASPAPAPPVFSAPAPALQVPAAPASAAPAPALPAPAAPASAAPAQLSPDPAAQASAAQASAAQASAAQAPVPAATGAPPMALLAPLGPPGGKLAKLAPLGGAQLPRPGALAPLAPLPGR